MTRKTYKETDRFELKTTEGTLFTAIETTTFLHADSHSGSTTIPGLKELRTEEGYHINFDGKGKYTILELGQKAERRVVA